MSAAMLEFPQKVQRQAKRRMDRVELEARHRWMREHSDKWENEETEGVEHEEYLKPRVRQLMKLLDEKWGKIKGPTAAEMRKRITEGRKLIEKRHAVKAWLRAQGADDDDMGSPEQALFFVFNKLA